MLRDYNQNKATCYSYKLLFPQPTRLNVFKNDQDTWDYTNPNLGGPGTTSNTWIHSQTFAERHMLYSWERWSCQAPLLPLWGVSVSRLLGRWRQHPSLIMLQNRNISKLCPFWCFEENISGIMTEVLLWVLLFNTSQNTLWSGFIWICKRY